MPFVHCVRRLSYDKTHRWEFCNLQVSWVLTNPTYVAQIHKSYHDTIPCTSRTHSDPSQYGRYHNYWVFLPLPKKNRVLYDIHHNGFRQWHGLEDTTFTLHSAFL